MTLSGADIRSRGAATRKAGATLAEASPAERAGWLDAAARLLEVDARGSSRQLAHETGLSEPMVRWGVTTTLETITAESLVALFDGASKQGTASCPLLAVVLAGNLFTAAIRALGVPLLLGVPVFAKASSSDSGFVRSWVSALRRANPRLAAAVDVVVFSGGDLECESALVEHAAALSVYGNDATVSAFRSRYPDLPATAHGHGVSASYCSAAAAEPERLDRTLTSVALDVCAYDQRGCLSPQVVYLEAPGPLTPDAFAERLAERLDRTNETLPRGPLPLRVGAEQAQWRGVAEVEGRLFPGATHAVAVRRPDAVRWSPGYRNVSVAAVASVAEAAKTLRPLGATLKCVGVDEASEATLAQRLMEVGLSAYVTPLGRMQTPALDAPADGKPVWHGLLRGPQA